MLILEERSSNQVIYASNVINHLFSYLTLAFEMYSLSFMLNVPLPSFLPSSPLSLFLRPYHLLPSLLPSFPSYLLPSLSLSPLLPLLSFLLPLSIKQFSISISHPLTLFFITSHILRVTYGTVLHVRAPLPGTLDLILSSGRWGVCGFPSGLFLPSPSLPYFASFPS